METLIKIILKSLMIVSIILVTLGESNGSQDAGQTDVKIDSLLKKVS